MKRLLGVLFYIWCFSSLFAADEIAFKHLGIKDGLSDSQINHITKDSQGFIWISTSYGLNRYDGHTFKVFTRKSIGNYSLPDNGVLDVQEGHDNLLWVHTARLGYVCYDPRKETFHPAEPLLAERYGIHDSPVLIYIDKEKNLWVHSYNGTYFYHLKEQELTFFPLSDGFKEKGIIGCCMAEDNEGVILLYPNGFLERIDRNKKEITYSNDYLVKNRKTSEPIHKIFVDGDGDYWVYADAGIWFYSTKENRWEHVNKTASSPYILTGDYVRDIKTDTNGLIWIAIDHGGINVINKHLHTIQYIKSDSSNERSLVQNSVNCLYCDDTGGIWAGYYKRGVSYYNESIFKFRTDHLPEFNHIKNFTADVNAITEDKYGNLRVGTSTGLVTINRGNNERKIYQHTPQRNSLPGDVIVCLLQGADGNTWIGTYRNGLSVFNGETFTNYKHEPNNRNSLANDNVWSLAKDENGYLWIGTLGSGLQGLDPRTGKFTRYAKAGEGFEGEYISSICIAKDKNIYLGTSHGVTFFSPSTKQFEKWTGNKKGTQEFLHLTINTVYEDSRGLLWIGTAGGLNIYDRKKDEIIIPVNNSGLESEIIQAIIEDNNKNMWITTMNGASNVVVHVDPITGEYSYSCRQYGELDGLQGQQFNPRAIAKMFKGEIIIGGVEGLSFFHPENLKYNNSVPVVKFSELQLFNKVVEIDSIYDGNRILTQALNYSPEIKLNYSQNVFSISFSAMNYVLPEKTTFMYMLEGFNSEWLTADVNKLTYTNLAPGKYTLKVKAINSDGFESHQTAGLTIVITPPFWASPLAYIVYFFIIIALLLGARWQILRNERQKYKLAQIEQEAQQKHEIDDMKLRFFTNISHELRTPLTLIITPLENVIKHIGVNDQKQKLEMVHRNAIRLLNMVNQLLDFRKSDVKGHQFNPTQGDIIEYISNVSNSFSEYSEKKNVHLTFFSAIDELWMVFDEDKIGKIIMNLLSNAFKFTQEGGRVDVSLDLLPATEGRPEQLEIKISDTGIGIDDADKGLIFDRFYQIQNKEGIKSSGSGIGLHLVREFVNLHGGNVTVCDNIGKGSVFIATLPVVRATKSREQESNAAREVEPLPVRESDTECPDEPEEGKPAKTPVILIVDDNDDFRLFMKDCLKEDYLVEEAANGSKAWKMIPEMQPDIIVSDIMMPEMDGNELCKLVKSDIRTSHIPLVLLSARSAKEHKIEGLESGADDYITKPFDFDILSLRIKKLLQLRQKRLDNFNRHLEIAPCEITITSLDEKLLKKAIRYVEDNISKYELSVEELSAELGMSRVHLYKKLLSITGKTPIEFIRIIRLKRAAQYLRESQQSVSEIAYQTGFNNPKYFRKYFKEEFGILPSEYQEKKGI